MITTLIFSRDRACQLDLLLRSIERFAPAANPVKVLYRATNEEYDIGYEIARDEHPDVSWRQESDDFQGDTNAMVRRATTDYIMCMTDDSLFRGELIGKTFATILGRQEIICFSLRLGKNTTMCYPLRRQQETPWFFGLFDANLWEWRVSDGDFGYPGSLDAHIFKKDLFESLIKYRNFRNPNELEDALVAGCKGCEKPLMASYKESLVVSLPVNRVNTTHKNRVGIDETLSEKNLNDVYIGGGRISLDALIEHSVNAAHVELPLEFV